MSKQFSDYSNLQSLFTGIKNKNVDIEKNIAPVESDASSSSKAYAVNSRLILGDKLYKVISAIDIGDALIVGTNIELSSNLVTLIGQGGGGAAYYAGPGINISDDNVISSKAVEFAGTQAEWDALSEREKSVFDYINITDDTSEETYQPGHSISDGTSEKTQREVLEFNGFNVTDDSVNGKTKISEVPYTAGSLIVITNKEISVDEDKVKATFVGTIAEWEALSSSEKAEYELVNLTDDLAGGAQAVVDAVEENNFSPVTSNAVYGNLAGFRFRNNNGVPELSMDGGATWNSLIGGSGGMKSKVAFGGLMNETTLTITLSSVGISVNSADDYFLIITPRQSDLTISEITKTQTQFTITRGSASTTPSLVVQVVYNPS